MRDTILIALLMVLPLGCHHAPMVREDALRVWRSSGSSLEQRSQAVTCLIPKGTKREEICGVLGTNCVLSHFYGPTLAGYPPHPAPDHDYWLLRCQFPGGGVDLRLEPATPEGGFVSAAPFRTLMRVPITSRKGVS